MKPLLVVLFLAGCLSACAGTSIQIHPPSRRPADLVDPPGTQSAPPYAQAPFVANLAISPNPAIRSQSATFTGSASGTRGATLINQYNLEFGDGDAVARHASATAVSVQHVYAKTGTYIATLTITNNNGDTAMVSTPVTVTDN
jgi:PKD repeat protein